MVLPTSHLPDQRRAQPPFRGTVVRGAVLGLPGGLTWFWFRLGRLLPQAPNWVRAEQKSELGLGTSWDWVRAGRQTNSGSEAVRSPEVAALLPIPYDLLQFSARHWERSEEDRGSWGQETRPCQGVQVQGQLLAGDEGGGFIFQRPSQYQEVQAMRKRTSSSGPHAPGSGCGCGCGGGRGCSGPSSAAGWGCAGSGAPWPLLG